MSEPEYDEDQTQNHDEIEDDQQLEVSAVFVSERPAVSGRGGKSTSKGKSATRRSKVFVTGVSDLTATEFSRKVVKALELVGTVGDGVILPFTYHHKGRAAKYVASVTSTHDFELMIQAINNKNLNMLIVEFLETELATFGVKEKSSVNETDNQGGLATHIGIPRVDAMSSLDMERAKIIQELQKRWKSCGKEGHQYCYINGKVHGQLTQTMLSTWAGYIHDHVATILKPPKTKAFDFVAQKKEIEARMKSESTDTTPAGSPAAVPTPLPLPAPQPPQPVPEPLPELTLFLEHVSKEHGIESTGYLDALVRDKMGPDVMGEMEVTELMGYGIPCGDAHCLKRSAQTWERRSAKKAQFGQGNATPPRNEPAPFQIAFHDNPLPAPPNHERTEAERAGRPHPGTEGNFCWQKVFPGEPGAGFTFWADMPSPTLDPHDPILAAPGTVQLRVAAGHYIDVPRAPRLEILDDDDGEWDGNPRN